VDKKIRLLLAKPGLDGHDRGMNIIARAYRDSGMEVIYLGLHQTPDAIIRAAVEEDVDVIALSVLSGAHLYLFEKMVKLMKKNNLEDVLLTGGGIINKRDQELLSRMGVGQIFGPGTPLAEAVTYIQDWVKTNKNE